MAKQKDFKTVKGILLMSVLLLAGVTAFCQTTSDKKGFVKIFDGKTLNGWEGDKKYWRVEGGNIVGEITPSTLLKTNSFLIWRGGKPADFELTLEFKISKNGNSGINYRSEEVANVPHALKGYQADIDGAISYTGQNYEERKRTTLAYRGEVVKVNAQKQGSADSLQNFIKNNAWSQRTVTGSLGTSDSLKAKINFEGWNTCRLIIKGKNLKHFINGILMSEVIDNDKVNGMLAGLIGVQVHVGPPMKVEYRNIMLRKFKS